MASNSMETSMRGFSFMCEKTERMNNLHYIEDNELERTWKHSRRERKKQREEKIWQEFIKENDVVGTVCEDDQYQFLDQLPENSLKQMMDIELEKIKKEVEAEEENKAAVMTALPIRQSTSIHSSNSNTVEEENPHTCVVSFANDIDIAGSDNIFNIFTDDKDELTDGEGEIALNDSNTSLPTVRERLKQISPRNNSSRNNSPENNASPDPSTNTTSSTGKSSGNVGTMIENSIYCGRVKELRTKITAEILNLMTVLDRRDIFSMDQDDISRMIKRSAEFCSRFHRIYIYQLQRQTQDIKRHESINLPFAKHTKFQSQMVRIVSLHLNLLQSFQVFRNSAEQSWCVCEGVAALRALLGAARAAHLAAAAVRTPRHLAAAANLYSDNLLESFDKLDEFVIDYSLKCEDFLNRYENAQMSKKQPRSAKLKTKKRPSVSSRVNKQGVSEMETQQLSMYSFETNRFNNKGSAKSRGAVYLNKKEQNEGEDKPKGQKKSPRSRRPLMRDPNKGQPRQPRVRELHDNDITTMVQCVDTCVSPLMSPPSRAKSNTQITVVTKDKTNNKKQLSPHNTLRKPQPKQSSVKPTNTVITSNNVMKLLDPSIVTPVCKVQYAVKIPPTNEIEMEIDRDIMEQESLQESSRQESPPIPCALMLEKLTETTNSNVGEKKEMISRYELMRAPDDCEVSKLLKKLCSGDNSLPIDRTSGAKNAQLIHMGHNPHARSQPTTPQLLRILEETIQKKVPKPHYHKPTYNVEKQRLTFNISDEITENMFQYRTKFVQHMLTSPMYANSVVGKPWEMVSSISEQIIEDIIMNCAIEMQLEGTLEVLFGQEMDL